MNRTKKAALSLLGLIILSCSTGETSIIFGERGNAKETYKCKGMDENLKVEYFDDGDRIKIRSESETEEMTRDVSGSGAFYRNGKNTFHTNSREAIFERDGKTHSCEIK